MSQTSINQAPISTNDPLVPVATITSRQAIEAPVLEDDLLEAPKPLKQINQAPISPEPDKQILPPPPPIRRSERLRIT